MDELGDRVLSFKEKFRSWICFYCCFRSGRRQTVEVEVEVEEKPRLIRSSSSWLRSRAQEIPELKEKCRSLISRMGRSRRQVPDLGYDPLSYALNFDEGDDETQYDDFRYRNFSSRLAPTPPTASPAPASVSAEIACS